MGTPPQRDTALVEQLSPTENPKRRRRFALPAHSKYRTPKKRDECASTLVPGSVTKQVSRIQPVRVETLVTLIFLECGDFPPLSEPLLTRGLLPRFFLVLSPIMCVRSPIAHVFSHVAPITANVSGVAGDVAAI
jgi:hypothetical protein